MGLLRCPDCGNAVSDKAPGCPKCGGPRHLAPAATQAAPLAPTATPRHTTHPLVLAAAVALVAVVGWSTWNSYFQSQLPPLPMAVQSRPAILGAGQVIMFENRSDQPLSVAATLAHPATNAKRVYQIYTGPHGSKSIGASDGWIGQSGDTVTLVYLAQR